MDRRSGGSSYSQRSSYYDNSGRSSFSQSDGTSRSNYHPYAQVNNHGRRSDGFNDRRGGGYNNRDRGYGDRVGGYNDRNGGYNDRNGGFQSDRNGGYNNRGDGGYHTDRRSGGGRGDRGRGYGSYRGRRGGGPGTGKARDDDSQTEPLPSSENRVVPLAELERYPMIFKKEMDIKANAYAITTKKAEVVYQYDIQWKGITKKGKEMNLNTQTKAAHKLQLKQVALFTVFDQLLRQYPTFFKYENDDSQFVYDTGSIFFAHKKLLDDGKPRELKIDIVEFSQEAKDFYKDVESAIAVVSFAGEINLNNLNGNLENDRPIIQYLELAFSQDQRKKGEYYCFGNEFFEKKSAEKIDQTPFVLKNGCKRSIRLIGDPGDKKLLIHIIPKKTAFYGMKSLIELIEFTIRTKIDNVWQRDYLQQASKAVSYLTITTTHMQNNRTFVSAGLSSDSAARLTFEFNGKDISVADYYYQTYNIRLRYPDLPCLMQPGGNCYPLEILEIAEVQKIPKAKQNNFLASKITNKCCFLPFNNVEAIKKQREEAEIVMSNDYIRNTGCRVDATRLLDVRAKQLYPPCIVFKNTQKTLNSGLFGMQTGDQFIIPAVVKKLAFVLASCRLSPEKAKDFVENLLQRLELYGVKIQEHEFFEWTHGGRDCNRLKELKEDGYDYVFAIGDDDELHHGLKLLELETLVVTQHVMTNTVEKANNSLFDNLAFKFNMKRGGLCWTLASDPSLVKQCGGVDLLKSLMYNTMFFGIDLSKPTKNADEPICVGFASNLHSNSACMSKGDFGYQSTEEALVNPELLSLKFTDALKAYYLQNGQYPSWIVVYRAGLSEGEIQKIQEKEIPVLKTAIEEMQRKSPEFEKMGVKLTFIMRNDKTNYRLFKKEIDQNEKATAQNLPPGTCVSEVIVGQKGFPSFLLISQRPLLGTAHPSCYYVLDGFDVVPFDHLQWLTYCLSYGNTNTSPTSMCGPLESASDLAKRARNNFKQLQLQKRREDSNGDTVGSSKKENKKDGKEVGYFDKLNNEMKSAIDTEPFWA